MALPPRSFVKEVGAGEAVQRQQEQRGHEHREDGDDQHVGTGGAQVDGIFA